MHEPHCCCLLKIFLLYLYLFSSIVIPTKEKIYKANSFHDIQIFQWSISRSGMQVVFIVKALLGFPLSQE